MVNAALLVEWGMPMPGRELMALEAFATHVGWWEELKTRGRVHGYHVYGLTTGQFGARSGFVVIDGTTEQIDALHHSEDFRANLDVVLTCVNDVAVGIAETGAGMTQRMERYGKTVKRTLG
jgi:hypothetical protein